MVTRPSPGPVVVRQLDDGRWKVCFPDGLTILTADGCGKALALVPAGSEFEVIPRDTH